MIIGSSLYDRGLNINASLDEFRISKVVRSEAQIAQDYNDGFAGIPLSVDGNTTILFHFDNFCVNVYSVFLQANLLLLTLTLPSSSFLAFTSFRFLKPESVLDIYPLRVVFHPTIIPQNPPFLRVKI